MVKKDKLLYTMEDLADCHCKAWDGGYNEAKKEVTKDLDLYLMLFLFIGLLFGMCVTIVLLG